MEFPIKFDAVKFHGHSIVYIEVSQVIISGSSILSKQIVQTLMLVSVNGKTISSDRCDRYQ